MVCPWCRSYGYAQASLRLYVHAPVQSCVSTRVFAIVWTVRMLVNTRRQPRANAQWRLFLCALVLVFVCMCAGKMNSWEKVKMFRTSMSGMGKLSFFTSTSFYFLFWANITRSTKCTSVHKYTHSFTLPTYSPVTSACTHVRAHNEHEYSLSLTFHHSCKITNHK